jgi:hypothetical protein
VTLRGEQDVGGFDVSAAARKNFVKFEILTYASRVEFIKTQSEVYGLDTKVSDGGVFKKTIRYTMYFSVIWGKIPQFMPEIMPGTRIMKIVAAFPLRGSLY